MFDITKVIIDPKATLGTEMLLTGVRPVYEYKDNIRQETIIGYRYEVVLPTKRFEKVSVKVMGPQKVDLPEENDYRPVEFVDLTMHIYYMQNTYRLYCEAADIRALSDMVSASNDEE